MENMRALRDEEIEGVNGGIRIPDFLLEKLGKKLAEGFGESVSSIFDNDDAERAKRRLFRTRS